MNHYEQFNAICTTVAAVLMISWAILSPLEVARDVQLAATWFSFTTCVFAWLLALKGEVKR